MTGAEFREARIAAGLSVRGAATSMGVSAGTIQRWEHADAIPNTAEAQWLSLTATETDRDLIAYTMGQLAAITEHVTGQTLPPVASNEAAARPSYGLAYLMRAYWGPKADESKRRAIDDQVTTLMARLPADLPSTMTMVQQGSYHLGYYHQRAELRG